MEGREGRSERREKGEGGREGGRERGRDGRERGKKESTLLSPSHHAHTHLQCLQADGGGEVKLLGSLGESPHDLHGRVLLVRLAPLVQEGHHLTVDPLVDSLLHRT